jgi:hypothetical protein
MNNEQVNCANHGDMTHCHKCVKLISWTGVIAGALIATGLSFLFNLFDIGIGLSVVSNSKEGVETVIVGGLIGMIIGAIVTMYVAGWVSGYIARPYCWNPHLGVLQGFTTWCLALIITLILLSSHVSFVTFGSQLLSRHVSTNPMVQITTNENAPAVSEIRGNRSQVTINAEKSANNLGTGTLITFLIFFLGAVSSCFGGYCGAGHRDHCCKGMESTPNKPM